MNGDRNMEKRKRFVRACVVFLLAVLVAFPSDMAAIQAKAAGSTGKSKILIAYFGRFGNTNFGKNVDATSSASIVLNSGKKQGTTEYLARQIQKQTGGDLFRIQTKKKYPADFDKLVGKNHEELDQNYLPALKTKVKKMKQYDIIFIGYPIWATDAPQAVKSFLKAYNLEGKTVIPFCTHEGSGSSGTYKQIRKLCSGADTLDGFSVNAEKVKTKSTQEKLKSWLNRVDVKSRSAKAVPITITIGNRKLNGVCYNTALGKQIMKKFPLKVTMDEFGGREYYGDVAKKDRPTKKSKGKLGFVNGDITYCFENDTMAIFYNQSDQPDLSMRVNCIGRVTSDLSVFDKLDDSVEIVFDYKK
ncbi:hypothetical protein D3Z36_15175 [Lachnospiraceae bacterium]|nr:hypothetical protein [Lachnospiraceae bacterium]